MADEIDRANDMAQRHLDAALNVHRQPHAVADECVECDTPISLERQKATGGTEYCFECASLNEKKGRAFRG